MSCAPALCVRQLTTAYRLGAYGHATTHTVFEGVTFDAHKGDRIAVTGPPGAGKTSLLLCIAGLLRPAHGEVRWQFPRARVAYVPAGRNYYSFLTVRETLDYYAASAAIAAPDQSNTIDRALVHVGLSTEAGARVGDISDSSLRRLRLAHALVTRPRALVLDELLSGADSTTMVTLADRLRTFAAAGGVVITAESTPIADEVLASPRTITLPPRAHEATEFTPSPSPPRLVAESRG